MPDVLVANQLENTHRRHMQNSNPQMPQPLTANLSFWSTHSVSAPTEKNTHASHVYYQEKES